MKKRVLAIATAVVFAFGFNACEPGQIDLMGTIDLTATNPINGWLGLTQPYADGYTVHYGSAMCNVDIDSVLNEAGAYDLYAGTVMVGTTQTLLTNDIANITFPLCGINLRDTLPGEYVISCPINEFGFYEYIDTSDINSLITTGLAISEDLGNLFAVAVSEDGYYLGYSGTVTLTSYGRNYQHVEGTVNNVEAVYITSEQLRNLINMDEEQRSQIDLSAYLPHITFNGQISTLRANLQVVLAALEEGGNTATYEEGEEEGEE